MKSKSILNGVTMDRYLTPEQVIEEILPNMTKQGLATLRFAGTGPAYRAPTPRKILYLESEVREWVEASARTQTGQAVA